MALSPPIPGNLVEKKSFQNLQDTRISANRLKFIKI